MSKDWPFCCKQQPLTQPVNYFISKCVTDINILHTYSPRVWYIASLLSTPSLRLEQTDCLVVRIVCVRVERHVYLWNVVSEVETVRLNNIITFLIQ